MDNLGTIFSPQMENLMLNKFEELLEKAVAAKLLETDVITQQEALKEYDISSPVLKRWVKEGLKRYEPPYEETRSYYYRRSEIERFLGMK